MSDRTVPVISVVVVGYRRPDLTAETLHSFLQHTVYPRDRLELIACDDGSPRADQDQLRTLPFDKWLLATRNEGLGANTNKGLRAATGGFVLQLQDDWLCLGPSDFLDAALELFTERPDVDMVRYHPTPPPSFPSTVYLTRSGRTARIFEHRLYESTGYYGYTDNPHIKRMEFHRRIGYYMEGVPMTTMELEFCARVDSDAETKIAFIEGYETFRHLGEHRSFNPSRRRSERKIALLRNPATRWPFKFYLWAKHSVWARWRADLSRR